MQTDLSNIKRIAPVIIPDGEYVGKWGGHEVEFQANGGLYQAKTGIGVKGYDIPVVVRIRDGRATIETV